MPFEFLCPNGHLLQAEESAVGQQCECPECAVPMLIPSPSAPDPAPSAAGEASGASSDHGASNQAAASPALRRGPDFSALGEAPSDHDPAVAEMPLQPPEVLHIPCPNGHVLETPEEMVGEEALCPFCNTQFKLRYNASLEHLRQQEEEEERRERRAARAWLHWSIAAAAVVLLGVILLFVVRASS